MCSRTGRIYSLCKLIGEAEYELTREMAPYAPEHSTLLTVEDMLVGRGDAWALGCFDRVRKRLQELGRDNVLVPELAEGHHVMESEREALKQVKVLREGRDLLTCHEIRPLIDQLDDLGR